jgi:hypothetical protein
MTMLRAMFLCVPLLATGCASVLSGKVVTSGDSTALVGASVLVEPVSRLPSPGRRDLEAVSAPELRAEVVSDAEGRFELKVLRDEAGSPVPLPSGWSYEVRAEALGYYTTVERVDVAGRSAEVLMTVQAIEELAMEGEIIEGEGADRHDGLDGGLVDEILRRSGRVPGGR